MTPTIDIDAILARRLAPLRPAVVYVFGSVAKGRARPDSDIDIAFLGPDVTDPVRVFDVAQEIAGEIGCDVDLVDLHGASAVMKAQVVASGRRAFVSDPAAADEFEMYALSDYARANEERREPLRVFEESLREG